MRRKKELWRTCVMIIGFLVILTYGLSQHTSSTKKLHDIQIDSDLLAQLNHYTKTIGEFNSTSANHKEERIHPGSITKLMGAYVVLQNKKDLNAMVVVPATNNMKQESMNMTGFYPMEEISIRELLSKSLSSNGESACGTLAKSIAGSEEVFVKMMNEYADQLGMKQTYFTNTTGQHDDAMYTTIEDRNTLFQEILKNEGFRKLYPTIETPSFI